MPSSNKNNKRLQTPSSSKWALVLAVSVIAQLTACVDNESSTGNDSNIATEVLQSSSIQTSEIQNTAGKTVPDFWPRLDRAVKQDPAMEQRIVNLLSEMTLEQKIAQMIQPEIREISVEDMRKYGFGSFINGGGSFPDNNKHATPADWINLAEKLYQASIDDSLDGSNIPTMWATDAVHGHNNVVGATLFPHNIGLGASNNPKLIEQIATVTAREVMVTGIDWVFAPTVAVVRDDRWGRTYEGYSEDPEIVKAYANAIVKGLQGSVTEDFLGEQRVIATVKHFIGDGGTDGGDDQGNNLSSERELFDIHAQGYVGGLSAGAQTVMASFNSWHGVKNHGNKYLLTDVLKTRLGFDGLVVGDWNGHGQIEGCSNQNCSQTINAGLDIVMVPTDAWKPLYQNIIAQVKNGEISIERINDAVSRILRVKMRAGLFTKPSPANRPLSGKTDLIGSAEHRAVARQAVRESLVLLKNNHHLLPLSPKQNILVAGDAADNIGKQTGGWTITWQGTNNQNTDFPGATSIYTGIQQMVHSAGGTTQLSLDGSFQQKPDVAIVVFGEQPYAEGVGDIDNLEYQRGDKKDLALLQKLRSQGIPVVSIFISGRPMWVNAELNASNAFVAAWLPGTEGQGISDVIFSKGEGQINYDFSGKLSFSWPASPTQTSVNRFDQNYQPLFPYGFGLTYNDKTLLNDSLNEVSDSNTATLKPRAVFQGTVKAPWQLFISARDGNRQPMTSSVLNNDVIQLRTIDKQVQEDARQIIWNGQGKGRVSIYNFFPEDLRAYLEAKSTLSIDMKIDSTILEPVLLSMTCQQNCKGSIDISPILKKWPVGEWQNISVDLACFGQQGADLGRISSPLSLTTNGQLKLSFAEAIIKPNSAAQATLSCQ